MKYRRLGRSGLSVSELCLGTMTFANQADEAESRAILDTAVEAGISFIDTADAYPIGIGLDALGKTEEIIGRWLKGRDRSDLVIATKGNSPTGPLPFQRGNGRQHLMQAIDDSLRRLGTDYVDVYLVHFYDRHTPVDETLDALDRIVTSGKARYVGCSNHLAYQVARALGRSEALGLQRYSVVQPRYNLLFRQFERELFPLCAEEGLGVMTYNPLAGGLLSGKYDFSAPPPEGTRFTLGKSGATYRDRYWDQARFDATMRVQEIAGDLGMDLPTLGVSWVLKNPVVSSVIIGASRAQQLAATLAAAEAQLPDDAYAALDEATREFRFGDDTR